MHARYYNPNIARFLSADPLRGDPQPAELQPVCVRGRKPDQRTSIRSDSRRAPNQMGEFCLALKPASLRRFFLVARERRSLGGPQRSVGLAERQLVERAIPVPSNRKLRRYGGWNQVPCRRWACCETASANGIRAPWRPTVSGPDYESVAVCAGPSVGICLTWTTDRVGRRYLNFAVGYGKSWPLATVSLVEGTFEYSPGPRGAGQRPRRVGIQLWAGRAPRVQPVLFLALVDWRS